MLTHTLLNLHNSNKDKDEKLKICRMYYVLVVGAMSNEICQKKNSACGAIMLFCHILRGVRAALSLKANEGVHGGM